MNDVLAPLLAMVGGAAIAVAFGRLVGRGRRASPSSDVATAALARREAALVAEEARVAAAGKAVEAARRETAEAGAEFRRLIEATAGIDAGTAKERALAELGRELEGEKARLILRAADTAREEADTRARAIVCTAIQRVAANHAAEKTVSSVNLPDELKGRVIGREGRNVRVFERATGCDVVVDETPGVVTISGFDPVRREIARRALSHLVADGRINPERIEEAVADAGRALEAELADVGRKALLDCDVGDAHPRIVALLGRLRYRTSYGQNVLAHSIEVAHLCGVMAAETGLDPRIARRVGLLHDLGKAIDHETEGAHAVIGGNLAKACGETPLIANAIASHHEDVAQESAYAVFAQAADAVSAARPGARLDAAERQVKRLKDLEAVAISFEGVSSAFAIQAGRELRVVVDATKVSDAAAVLLARAIAAAVEGELSYPGEIKVTVLRETEAVHYAR